jgi:predicted phosphoadenosine phosphosulfate sulfurtransferase
VSNIRIYYTDKNVFDAAIERIEYLFSEFENVIVNISGGKDSTVILNLSLMVARKLNRLPLAVMFLDQEAEWECVIDYIRTIMYDAQITPYWLQVPIRLTNATSTSAPYLWCWRDGDRWLRDKESISIHQNKYGTDRFHPMFKAFIDAEFKERKACYIAGVRCEESPGRQLGLTTSLKYKHIPWGKILNKRQQHYSFYPIYDWSYRDVWHAIEDNGWRYSKIYDYQFQYGLPIHQMRVSNVHHETALYSLFYMQEIEPNTWNKLTERLAGVHTAGQLQWDNFCPPQLPYMFNTWYEYRDYLADNLITDPKIRDLLKREFTKDDTGFVSSIHKSMITRHINAILVNDVDLTRMGTWRAAHLNFRVRKGENEYI